MLTLRWPAFRCLAWLPVFVALLLPALPSEATAQTYANRDEGLRVGHFLLYPTVTFGYDHSSNVLYSSEDVGSSGIVGSGLYTIKPRLMVDLPVGENRIRWVYSPLYRSYTSDRVHQTERLSHYFDFEGSFRVGPSLSLVLTDHLVHGTVELDQVDRGGELTFGLVPFVVHEPSLEATLGLGARSGLSVLPRYSSVTFDQGGLSFFSYRRRGLETRYNYKLSEPSVLYGYYAVDETDQEREQVFFGKVRITERSLGVGLRRTVNQVVLTRISAGYKTMRFEGGIGKNFSGPVAEVSATLTLGPVTYAELTLTRQAYQSFYVNDNFYVSSQAGVKITQQIGRRTYWIGSTLLESNVYADPLDLRVHPQTEAVEDCNGDGIPDSADCNGDGVIDAYATLTPSQGVRRKDLVLRTEVGFGFQVHPRLLVYLGYNYEKRNSNIVQELGAGGTFGPFDYTVERVTFSVRTGWM